MKQQVSRIQFQKSDLEISRLVFGCWRLADSAGSADPRRVLEKIHAALEAGITTFDHADIYGNYGIEELFGRALQIEPQLKKEIEIVTKTGIRLLSEKRPENRLKSYDTSKGYIRKSVENSLRSLQVEKIDLLLIHRPDYLANVDEIAEVFQELRVSGKVREFGVSNHSVSQITLLQSRLPFPLVTHQIEISPYHMNALDDGVLDACQVSGMYPMAWSPLGGGRLVRQGVSGSDAMENDVQTLRIRHSMTRVLESRKSIAEWGSDLHTASFEHVAFAWLLAHPAKIIPVLGTGNVQRIKSAGIAEQIKLTREEWYDIWQAAQGREVP